MKGPGKRLRRREAPIRCGFARTYEAGMAQRPFGTLSLDPTAESIDGVSGTSNQPFVQALSQKW